MCDKFSITECGKLIDAVGAFDSRLLTIKGWSVTLSFVILAQGFDKKDWRLFLLAALSGIRFWLLDAQVKGHQMRYYPRMREIEVTCFLKEGAPSVDWSWQNAPSTPEAEILRRSAMPPIFSGSTGRATCSQTSRCRTSLRWSLVSHS